VSKQNPAIRSALVEALRADWRRDPRRTIRIAERQAPAVAGRLQELAAAHERDSEALGASLAALAEGLQARTARPRGEDPPLEDLADQLLWPGTTGEIHSSGDWALMREDGLLVLEARFTIKPAGEDNTFISVYMTGSADVRALFNEPLTGEQAYERWM